MFIFEKREINFKKKFKKINYIKFIFIIFFFHVFNNYKKDKIIFIKNYIVYYNYLNNYLIDFLQL